jgi:hypothetical protein
MRIIWDHSNDEVTAGLMLELMALANHRKSIRAEITDVGERLRRVWIDALSARDTRHTLPETELSTSVLLFLLAGIPKLMLLEGAFDLSMGHGELSELIDDYLKKADSEPVEMSDEGSNDGSAETSDGRVKGEAGRRQGEQ